MGPAMSKRVLLLFLPVSVVALAGCPQVVDEREQALAAWLKSDWDGDGLPTEIELKFGLDPQDPTDGPDIDGDGIPNYRDNDVDGDGVINETDPDIDGDGIPNDLDGDVDGDGVPDEVDFDSDADGIRDEWDLDFDSDGAEDLERPAAPEFLAEEFLELAVGAMSDDDDDDGDDDDGVSAKELFEAYIEYLVRRAGEGDASAAEEYERYIRQVISASRRPVKPDSFEAETTMEKLAGRFEDDPSKVDKFETALKSVLNELVDARGGDEKDATDAITVLFHQATRIKNPEEEAGHLELQDRLDGLRTLVKDFGDADLDSCSKTVDDLFAMPGEGTNRAKLDAFTELKERWGPDADLKTVMDSLDDLKRELDAQPRIADNWTWRQLAEAIATGPDVENGDPWDLSDHVYHELMPTEPDDDPEEGDNGTDDGGNGEEPE